MLWHNMVDMDTVAQDTVYRQEPESPIAHQLLWCADVALHEWDARQPHMDMAIEAE